MKPFKQISILIIIFFSLTLNAQIETRRIISQNSYQIGQNAGLSIIHKFGTITIKNHEAERIDAEVAANLKVSSEDEIEKLLGNITLVMSGNEQGLKLETIFDNDLAGNRKNSATIDIIIHMPVFVNVSIEHKFGNTIIESIAGTANLTSEYGNLEIQKLVGNENKIKILQGDLKLRYLLKANVKTEHSSIDIGQAGDVKIESVFSNIQCENAENLQMNLEGGKVSLTTVRQLRLNSNFSSVEIQNLETLLISKTEYTNISIATINKSFNTIEIDATFSTIDIGFGSNPDFQLSGLLSFSKFNYPEKEWQNVTKGNEKGNIVLKGFTGTGQTMASVQLNSNYGNIQLR